ncbi:MAG: hypothetical protein NZM15_10315 [Flavobacteriales bacterium]|nr:hypothetical protein [Flavobacteriales bacterium]MDW8433077.1 hypothetical protein [Flavobacteriales bacterium]
MPVRSPLIKGIFNPVWTSNSFAALLVAFIFIGLISDVAFYFIARYFDLIPKMQFDQIVEISFASDVQYFRRKVVLSFSLSFFALPLLLVLIHNYGYRLTVRRLANWKLYFLWGYIFSLNNFLGYLAFSSLGDKSKVLTGLLRRKFKIILEYIGLSEGWLPFLTAFIFTTYALLGSRMFARFLLMSPSNSLNKNSRQRVIFILNTVIFPLLLFTLFGQWLYLGDLPYESRYQNMLIFWGPALVMLYRAHRNGLYDRVPALSGSWIDYPDVILYGLALILVTSVVYVIPAFFYE